MKKALITGITGQDGSYLSELLLDKGYKIYGVVRRASSINTYRIDHLYHNENMKLIYGDLANGIENILYDIEPDEIYNLGGQSHVKVSFDIPVYTLDINAAGPLKILEAIHRTGIKTKFYQASSSEMFGLSQTPQNEDTPFNPCSPYGVAKLAAYNLVKVYRNGYGIFSSNGILFNHESERRGETFVTKKIVRAAVKIKLNKQDKLILGNLESKRDFGHSKDYMRAIYLIMQHDLPDDFVVATGKYYSIKEFLIKVFSKLDLDYKQYVIIDDRYKRPIDIPELLGDATKIQNVLGWEPKIDIDELIDEMVSFVMKEEIINLDANI